MSLLGLTPTLATSNTQPSPLELAFSSNPVAPTVANMTARVPTSTTPVSLADGAAGNPGSRLVVPARLNYAKVQVLASADVTAGIVYMIGWNRDSGAVWRPQLICTLTGSNRGGTNISVNGSNLQVLRGFAKGVGDVKIYDVDTTNFKVQGSFYVVDLNGCELLEIAISTSAAVSYNAFIGFF